MKDITRTALSRRNMLRTTAGAAMAGGASAQAFAQQAQPPAAAYNPTPNKRIGQPQEGPNTPKLTIYMDNMLDEAEARRIKQLGINWVDAQAVPAQPWGMDYLQPRVDALKKQEMRIGILMIRWSYQGGLDPQMNKIVRGLPGRDEEIAKIKQTIANCGKLGIPVVEWNFFTHRATDAYKIVPGRGGAGDLDF